MEQKSPVGEYIVDHLTNQNPVQENELQNWVDSSEKNQEELAAYKKIWEASADIPVLQQFNTEEAWEKVDAEISSHQQHKTRIRSIALVISGMAASLIIVLGLHFYTNLFTGPEKVFAMTTTYGSRSDVILPDGSQVKLNAGTSLKYHFDKETQTRRIDFSGEAYFEVAKSHNPFEILTNDGLKVKVLGTKFNLTTYPDDQFAQTSLFEGKVELSREETELTLNPGEMAVLDKSSSKLEYKSGEISRTTSWMQNKLYMENMSLTDVCKYLERWYDVEINFKEEELGDKIHYTGVLKEQTVIDVLNALCRLSAISYEINSKNITIKGRK